MNILIFEYFQFLMNVTNDSLCFPVFDVNTEEGYSQTDAHGGQDTHSHIQVLGDKHLVQDDSGGVSWRVTTWETQGNLYECLM